MLQTYSLLDGASLQQSTQSTRGYPFYRAMLHPRGLGVLNGSSGGNLALRDRARLINCSFSLLVVGWILPCWLDVGQMPLGSPIRVISKICTRALGRIFNVLMESHIYWAAMRLMGCISGFTLLLPVVHPFLLPIFVNTEREVIKSDQTNEENLSSLKQKPKFTSLACCRI